MINAPGNKSVRIVSVKENVEIAAAKEILLTAGGSYIRISKDGIEHGTSGKWTAYAAQHSMEGPKTHNAPVFDLPIAGYTKDVEFVFTDMYGNALANEQINLTSGTDFNLLENTDEAGKIKLENINQSSLHIVQGTRKG